MGALERRSDAALVGRERARRAAVAAHTDVAAAQMQPEARARAHAVAHEQRARKHAEGGNEHKAAGHMLKVLKLRAARKAHMEVAEGTYSSVAELEDGRRAEELRANLELRKVQVQLRIQHLESWAEWHCKQITEIYTAHNGSGARPAPDDEQRSA